MASIHILPTPLIAQLIAAAGHTRAWEALSETETTEGLAGTVRLGYTTIDHEWITPKGELAIAELLLILEKTPSIEGT